MKTSTSMFNNNSALLIISLIAVVNALGYGIIIPILYSYSKRFGLTDVQIGLLFATFSFCQFFSTPIIGRLSDTYGRKPLLVLSISGTAVSFLMMALAPNALFLFFARALDGITAGNNPVASAVISDTTSMKDRSRGFGIIGASFGLGLIVGPAISALTVGFGAAVPFIIAATVSLVAVFATILFLPETNLHKGHRSDAPIINMKKRIMAATDEKVGGTLIVSLVYSVALSLFIYAYQPFSVNILKLGASEIAYGFMLFGLVGLIAQLGIIHRVIAAFGDTRTLKGAFMAGAVILMLLYWSHSYVVFTILTMFFALANGFINPLIQTILSKEVDEKSQGSIMGLNSSYISIGMIVGPIVGGILASFSSPLPFIGGACMIFLCTLLSNSFLKRA